MKIEEAYLLIVEKQLEENRLKHAIAATAIAAGSMLSNNISDTSDKPPKIVHIQSDVKKEKQPITDKKRLFDIVSKKYRHVDKNLIRHGIDIADKYADPVFPKLHHILAIIENESTWDPKAIVYPQKGDGEPAKGLMQVKFKTNNLHPNEFNSIEGQIRSGITIYKNAYNKTKDIHKALLMYNLGSSGMHDPKKTESGKRYIKKFEDSVNQYME